MYDELIKKLRCGGHNMMFNYCSKIDCPFCQFSYYENLHKCNMQDLGANAADAIERLTAEVERLKGEHYDHQRM